MSDNIDDKQEPQEHDDQGTGDQELTFEHGYADQDNVLSDGESLEDVAGVSEEDVRRDLLREKQNDEDEAS